MAGARAQTRPSSHYTTIERLRLHHLRWGPASGPVVVLLHGLRAHAYCWERLAPSLAPPFQLLALDFRGHGESDWSEDGYGTAAYLADLAAWLDVQELARVDLIGHSAGGRVAVAYAARHPERVRRLVVIDIGPDVVFRPFDPTLAARPPRRFRELAEVVAALRPRYPTVSATYLRRLAAHSVRRAPAGGWQWKWDQRVRGQPPPPEAFRADLRALGCPTLVVRGAERGLLTAEGAARMQALVADCRVAAIPGTGHNLHEERPAVLARVVRAFLSGGAEGAG
ncbi:MAG: alpha/beta hydrolase [Chloroflexi bacterium]|nr:alpha/beta hydrolase [Chloroflexota bacterium]